MEGIQAAATDLSDAPESADGDFSSVAFYNKVSLSCIVCGQILPRQAKYTCLK